MGRKQKQKQTPSLGFWLLLGGALVSTTLVDCRCRKDRGPSHGRSTGGASGAQTGGDSGAQTVGDGGAQSGGDAGAPTGGDAGARAGGAGAADSGGGVAGSSAGRSGDGGDTTSGGAAGAMPSSGGSAASAGDPGTSGTAGSGGSAGEGVGAAGTGGTGGTGGSGGAVQPVDGRCESGWGLHEETNECWPCAEGVPRASACDDPGETGTVLIAEAHADAECLCETVPGYFIGSSGESAIPCDQDDDGWVKESAQPSIEGSDELRQRNARCEVTHITEVMLENADGATLTVPVGNVGENGLPLYEEDRNDDPDSHIGTYGLSGSYVNGFTKGCSAVADDYNFNGASDAQETPTSQRRSLSSQLGAYYEEYARFSYFMELHKSELIDDGTYLVRERSREDFDGWYPEWDSAYWDYWRYCDRHIDSTHDSGQAGPGGDFSGFGDGHDWVIPDGSLAVGGMLHHSQFKCVAIDTVANVGAQDMTRGYVLAVGTGGRADPVMGTPLVFTGDDRANRWALSTCTVSGSGDGVLSFACPPLAPAEPVLGRVYWAAVGYENASADEYDYRYVRGCINGCAEIGITQCDNNPMDLPESERWVCQYAKSDAFGYAVCGCGLHYYGGTCEVGCPDAKVFVEETETESGFVPNRSGYWMCGSMTASLATPLSGGDYTLRGFVPVTGVVGELEGGGYRLTPAPAGNP